MATITLKGNREPIITDYETAKKVKEWWLDNSVPNTAKTEIDDTSCLKGEIKQINLSSMGTVRNKEDHWIIYSAKRNSIWQRTYPSYEEAKEEYDRQMEMLHPEVRAAQDWEIEKRSANVSDEKEKNNGKEDDGFGGF